MSRFGFQESHCGTGIEGGILGAKNADRRPVRQLLPLFRLEVIRVDFERGDRRREGCFENCSGSVNGQYLVMLIVVD